MGIQKATVDYEAWKLRETAFLVDLCGLVVGLDMERYRALDNLYMKQVQHAKDTKDDENIAYRQQRYHDFFDAHEQQMLELSKLRSIAEAGLDNVGGTLKISAIHYITKHPIINVQDFREWTVRLGIDLPEGFPKNDREKNRVITSTVENTFPEIVKPKRVHNSWYFSKAIIEEFRRKNDEAGDIQTITLWLKQSPDVPGYGQVQLEGDTVISLKVSEKVTTKTIDAALNRK